MSTERTGALERGVPEDYDLDDEAKGLIAIGMRGLVATSSNDGMSFDLQARYIGLEREFQLRLRRPAPGSNWTGRQLLHHLRSMGLGTAFLPGIQDLVSEHAAELNGRCRIKSILMVNTLTTLGHPFRVLEFPLQAGEMLKPVEHDLSTMELTGRHWVLVY